MSVDPRRAAFRAILAGDALVRPAIVFDPLSVRMAAALGYETGMIPGSDVALSVLGAPDIALITMSEFVDQVHRMTRAASLPLLADGDHGYGNALNVRRFVAELDTVGLAAVTIEDTDLPAPFDTTRAPLIPLDEMVGKLRAALEGRRDPSFTVVGRTHLGLATGGRGEMVSRARAFAEAGVDALFVVGLKTREDLDILAEAVALPLILPKPAPAIDDAAYLASRRVRVCFPGAKKASVAAIDAAHAALVAGRPGASPLASDHAALIRRLTDAEAFDRARARYLRPGTPT